MAWLIIFFATIIATSTFSVAPAQAVSSSSAACGGRIVSKPRPEPRPGCHVRRCRVLHKIAHDEKGTYCIRSLGCRVDCDKPKE
jgi:hypothetical protein